MARNVLVSLVAAVVFLAACRATAQPCLSWGNEFYSIDLDSTTTCSTRFNDGSGTALYVGGKFTTAGGIQCNRIAKWNGAAWSPLAGGMTLGSSPEVRALAVYNDGGGNALYAAGLFRQAGGTPVTNIARWNGSGWTDVGGGSNAAVNSLVAWDDGSGPALFAAGNFSTMGGADTKLVAKWNGSAWSPLAGGIVGTVVNQLLVFDDGSGEALYAAGDFTSIAGVPTACLARWDGVAWTPIHGLTFLSSPGNTKISALAAFNGGAGLSLYAGGVFDRADGQPAYSIARWNGATWSPAGSAFQPGPGHSTLSVTTLHSWFDGSRDLLFAGGTFHTGWGMISNYIAAWDGAAWTSLRNGTDGPVTHVTSFDDTLGSNVLVFGGFTYAPPYYSPFLARWTGTRWIPRDNGLGDEGVGAATTMQVFDDGSGPALFVGGGFNRAGGIAVSGIAKWDGEWSDVGGGLDAGAITLLPFDDGGGEALYAGGGFDAVGPGFSVPASKVARWDGTSWSAVGPTFSAAAYFNASVRALAAFDDGAGESMYAAGVFRTNGDVPSGSAASWDGTAWSSLAAPDGDGEIRAAVQYDDGTGPALYVAGTFSKISSVTAARIAKWNGASWSPLGAGINPGLFGLSVSSLAVYDAGSGPELYVGGDFFTAGGASISDLARWNGSTWSAVPGSPTGGISEMITYDDGSGPALYVAGSLLVPGVGSCSIARYDGSAWSRVGDYFNQTTSVVVFDDGSGPTLWAARTSGTYEVRKLMGTVWQAMGPAFYNPINKMAVYDDGAGPALYIGGEFTLTTTGEPIDRIAKWTGSTWAQVGGGIPAFAGISHTSVTAMRVHDDGGGPVLVVGGNFRTAGGADMNGIAKWNGAVWSAAGNGVECRGQGAVKALSPYNLGSGNRLFAGGEFSAISGKILKNIARWDNGDWYPLAQGIDQSDGVNSLAVFDDGTGPALYVAGDFDSVSGIPASNIAKWDGVSWSPLGLGVNGVVHALCVYDDGTGPALYVGGYFAMADGAPAKYIARWNGVAWSGVGGGMDGGEGTPIAAGVYDLRAYDDGGGLALYAAGQFSIAGEVTAHGIAKWDGAAWSALAEDGPAECVLTMAPFDRAGVEALYVGGYFSRIGDMRSLKIASWGPCPSVGGACPTITTEPISRDVVAGDATTLEVVAAGAPPLIFQWYKDGEVILDGGPVSGAHTPTLSIDAVELEDEGAYTVSVANDCGTVISSPALLDVICPADLVPDGLVDFSDYLEFLNLYDLQDIRADLNHDGFIDFIDYLEFLNHFSLGC